MEITFAAGMAGFDEARALLAIARTAATAELGQRHEREVLDFLKTRSALYLERAEFADLRTRLADADAPAAGAGPDSRWWRSLFGPSRRELRLSEQRSAALERAARAERSSFEALAETARVARERDAARARIAELERELHQARHGHR